VKSLKLLQATSTAPKTSLGALKDMIAEYHAVVEQSTVPENASVSSRIQAIESASDIVKC
jgi:hypothetical protein